jgi:pSer/pThr/pTyr-binding forkhead associated (FHA) protein
MAEYDYRSFALTWTHAQFVDKFDCPFLLSRGPLKGPKRPQPTQSMAALDVTELDPDILNRVRKPAERSGEVAVLAVRKVTESFPGMITAGRTANNDIVIADVSVSKFHAFFKVGADGMTVGDAGSRFGTIVGGAELVRRGPTVPVAPGAIIRFGDVTFDLLEPGMLWKQLRGL